MRAARSWPWLQKVTVNLRVLTHPVEADLPKVYSELGEDVEERVLPSVVNEVWAARRRWGGGSRLRGRRC